ncbi:MAG: hypothetical protein HWE25_10910 [Alphaproteobacteria bacterium]|nr:hypothetical protein [Alphaproteobacteria bacterium]
MSEKLNSVRLLKWIVWTSIVLIVGMTTWFWADPESLRVLGVDFTLLDKHGGPENLAWWQKLAGFGADALPAGLLVTALLHLLGLLHQLELGNWFDQQTEKACERIGKTMLWYLLASFFNETILVLILTVMNAPGERQLSISLSSDTLLGLVPALMALVIAQMVRHARAQRDELNQIV